MKIRTKLLAFITVSVIVPIIIISSFSIYEARVTALDNFETSSRKEITQIDNAFTLFFKAIADNVTFLADLPLVKDNSFNLSSFVNGPGSFKSHLSAGGQEAELFRIYEKFGQTHPGLAYVYSGRADGGYIQWPDVAMKDAYDPRTRPWYKKALQNPGEVVRTGAYYWAGDDATFVGTAKTITDSSGKVMGVQSMDVSVKQLTEIVQQIKIGERGHILLVEDNGTVLVDPLFPEHNFKKIDELNSPLFKQLASVDSGLLEVERNGEHYLAKVVKSSALGWRFVALVPSSEVYQTANNIAWLSLVIAALLIALFIIIGAFFSKLITRPIDSVAAVLKSIAEGEGDLTTRLPIASNDEVGELSRSFNQFIEKLQSIIQQIVGLSGDLKTSADAAAESANNSMDEVKLQQDQITLVATSVEEMSAATQDIAANAENTSHAASESARFSQQGQAVVMKARDSIGDLAGEVSTASQIILKLSEHSQQINSILGTIQGIAEQTNLLALNAAIEAARAGDNGRGFAVVADEVRSLSQKTTISTADIRNMIATLQSTMQQAVSIMASSEAMAQSSVEEANQAYEQLILITDSVNNISDMSAQIATATEEQSMVNSGIAENTSRIKMIADQMLENADTRLARSRKLHTLSEGMHGQVGLFKV
ncbi:methyl-accepting chemotaxis protein [Amphritea pacifica]|uniref:Methyl-accepting chemotaxis protein n=1 Tax=Amphritea pacifica TaxID=2811233 RepID=A0ABS2W258_9GAMM|nr:methyl-accepting chemotaxis protein [Amphritea pacifica]MBN0985803.1 methyl-accepting chemotaxis protein [Amphritea pacifica]MBN1005884.1 methyl-accepting chemotaxis protein [Amphritea pacifica]